jgi:hypothetical protein
MHPTQTGCIAFWFEPALMTSIMERYKAFVRQNAGLLSLLESGVSPLHESRPAHLDSAFAAHQQLHTCNFLVSGQQNTAGRARPAGCMCC